MRTAIIVSCFLLVGCAGTPINYAEVFNTNTPAAAGNKPANPELAVKDYLRQTLKDPRSVQDLVIGNPSLEWCEVKQFGPYYAWVVPVEYNAKNGYGAYAGLSKYFFRFHSDALKGVSQTRYICNEASDWR